MLIEVFGLFSKYGIEVKDHNYLKGREIWFHPFRRLHAHSLSLSVYPLHLLLIVCLRTFESPGRELISDLIEILCI